MSSSRQEFIRLVTDDSDFRAQLTEAASDPAKVVALAKAKGFDFTVDDVKSYLNSDEVFELSDEQMEEVAGGVYINYCGDVDYG